MWLSLVFYIFLKGVVAYREESFDIEFVPDDMRVTDACTLYIRKETPTESELAVIRFHHDGSKFNTSIHSEIIAINQDCSTVLFGFPDEQNTDDILAEGTGVVRVWHPGSTPVKFRPVKTEISWIEDSYTYEDEAIPLYRFGFSVDIQGDTWIVGAPGKLRDDGRPVTIGYAFVYHNQELHSCRSLYETGCYPDGDKCALGYIDWKRYYGFYKYAPGDGKTMLDDTENGQEVNAFQKKCIPEQLPYYKGGYYGGGPLNPVLVPYFEWQQFGYSVAITGSFNDTAASIFVSAPGDTNRFIENNPHEEGDNYGRVYAWDLSADTPREKDIFWWSPSLLSPYGPPNLRTPHYQAYGRAIAASKSVLAVSSYPLYFNTREPFVIIYDCNPLLSNCRESENRGISIDKIPGNALRLTSEDLSYSDRVIAGPLGYIKAPEYQNVMIGDDIGVAGSNVIIRNKHHTFMGNPHPQAHRFGKDARLRETHDYSTTAQYGSNTQHWVLANHHEVTHYWPCDLGYTGGKPKSFETTKVSNRGEHCIACEVAYYSDDGWLEECDLCPVNKTSYEEAQSECKPVVRRVYEGISWEDTRTIIIILSVGTVLMWLLCVGCQYTCYRGRKKRRFKEERV
jgi:hypothetical protein|tara:strand:- start:545 stop:2413 length:1869 start_codon:yes stop_codon:yes gene_type:complete